MRCSHCDDGPDLILCRILHLAYVHQTFEVFFAVHSLIDSPVFLCRPDFLNLFRRTHVLPIKPTLGLVCSCLGKHHIAARREHRYVLLVYDVCPCPIPIQHATSVALKLRLGFTLSV